jgi:hypothetical protein
MGFLIRTTFWFSLVLLLLPFGGDGSSDDLGPLQALLAAREAVQDISGICERKPDVCEAGQSALHTIGVKAKASARFAYDMLDDEKESDEAQPDDVAAAIDDGGDVIADTIKTGTVAVPKPRPSN